MTIQKTKSRAPQQQTQGPKRQGPVQIPQTTEVLERLEKAKPKWQLVHKKPPHQYILVDYCRQCGREGCYDHCGYGIGQKRKKVRTS